MLMTMMAALAATQAAPAMAPAQPAPMAQHSADHSDAAMKDCCCKDMKSKAAGQAMGSTSEHQGHDAH